MRILLDYRPALRSRSGVGEYVHQLVRYLAAEAAGDVLTLFTSSWKDRPDPALATSWPNVRLSDHRVPVAVLNLLWHNLEWPPVESLGAGEHDVVFSPHPLLTPSRRAAQVVMVHDLDFLTHPERTPREIRRDYPRLAASHTKRAARVIVPSHYTAGEVTRRLGVPTARIAVCPQGAPVWGPAEVPSSREDGFILFMGTLEPRKNVGALLSAYARLLGRLPDPPKLVLAGSAGPAAKPWLKSIARPPLAGRVAYLGYVSDERRQAVYAGARVLVLPSFDEGFGMPALEAMSLGVPVIASDRGALPEVVGEAGLLVGPEDEDALVNALVRVLSDTALAEALSARGRDQARRFNWTATARAVRTVFEEAAHARAHWH